jgi:hypothetical protein
LMESCLIEIYKSSTLEICTYEQFYEKMQIQTAECGLV